MRISALEPYIDEQTMHLHHDKHHQAYIDNANKVVADYPELQKKTWWNYWLILTSCLPISGRYYKATAVGT